MWRCLTEQHSGRAFLQTNALLFPNLRGVLPYFVALRSPRRLALLEQAADGLYETLSACSTGVDLLARHPELDGFWLFAGNGHDHAAAVHDPRVLGAKDGKAKPAPRTNKSMDRVRVEPVGTQYAVGHFFLLNFRNNLMGDLVVADPQERRKEHDMRALKALSAKQLRRGAPKGTRVLYACDRAGIDFLQWQQWKQAGVYFLSLEKANMTLDKFVVP